jgi:hypothetical protein
MSKKKIIPKCKNNLKPYIDATGRWQPCCYFHGTKRLEVIENDEFLVKEGNDLNNFHKIESFVNWIKELESDYDKAPLLCKQICGTIDGNEGEWKFTPQYFINNYFPL